jgi:hypothetical protein
MFEILDQWYDDLDRVKQEILFDDAFDPVTLGGEQHLLLVLALIDQAKAHLRLVRLSELEVK